MKPKVRYVLAWQSLPSRMPLGATILLPMAVDYWGLGSVGMFIGGLLTGLLWLAYIASLFIEKPINIFEDHEARQQRLEKEQA